MKEKFHKYIDPPFSPGIQTDADPRCDPDSDTDWF
jgi:hypothetical protein